MAEEQGTAMGMTLSSRDIIESKKIAYHEAKQKGGNMKAVKRGVTARYSPDGGLWIEGIDYDGLEFCLALSKAQLDIINEVWEEGKKAEGE